MIALICLLPMSGTDKAIEILALRRQLVVVQRQIGDPGLTHPTGHFSPPSCTDSPAHTAAAAPDSPPGPSCARTAASYAATTARLADLAPIAVSEPSCCGLARDKPHESFLQRTPAPPCAGGAAPQRPLSLPITEPDRVSHLASLIVSAL